jgi:hypothetical protein
MGGEKQRSELLRANHGHEEIEKEGEGDEPDENGFHGGQGRGLELFAEAEVETADDEKGDGHAEVEEVTHGSPPVCFLGGLSWTHRLPQWDFQRIKGRPKGVKKVSMTGPVDGLGLMVDSLRLRKCGSGRVFWCA